MKRIFSICAALSLCLALSGQEKATVIHSSIDSKVLGAPRAYTVILPAGYNENPEKEYPILYLLHGMYGENTEWSKKAKAGTEMTLMVNEHRCLPMIIVSPYAGGKDVMVEQNGYFDVPNWPYETFFFEEFLPFIESEYRVVGDKKHRAVAGLSMGGGGATAYAQKHPEMFCASYAMSAWLGIRPEEQNSGKYTDDKLGYLYQSVDRNNCVEFVKNADAETVEKLNTVKWFIDCGDDDFLLDINLLYYQTMRDRGIPCQLRVRDGAHKWEYWHTALQTCLPFVSICFSE